MVAPPEKWTGCVAQRVLPDRTEFSWRITMFHVKPSIHLGALRGVFFSLRMACFT